MEEIFRDMVGYEGHYIVSNTGRVISIKFNKRRELKPYLWSNKRYYYVHVCKNGVHGKESVARAVARAFPEICGEWFEGCTVDHINTVPTDNRAENLRVVSLKDNINNPLTIAKMRGYKTDEERIQHKKEMKQKENLRYAEYRKEYYKKNREKFNAYMRKYLETHPEQKEKSRIKSREYYYKHKTEISKKRTIVDRQDIFKKGGLI